MEFTIQIKHYPRAGVSSGDRIYITDGTGKWWYDTFRNMPIQLPPHRTCIRVMAYMKHKSHKLHMPDDIYELVTRGKITDGDIVSFDMRIQNISKRIR